MITLTKAQILFLHSELLRETGGAVGIRDKGLLESAITSPFQSFENVSPYPSIQQKAARLGFGLVENHPFVDGNKRTGAHAMLVFLALNGIELEYTQEELSNIFLAVASGNAGFAELLQWILEHEKEQHTR